MTLPPRRCPDISTCHASLSGTEGLVYCLNEQRVFCDYFQPFGEKHFCRHPQGVEIATQSKAFGNTPPGEKYEPDAK